MRLGEYVKNERLNRGLTQYELAEKCNLSFVTINFIENNKKPGIKSLNTLSEFFGISVEELRKMMNDKYEDNEQE